MTKTTSKISLKVSHAVKKQYEMAAFIQANKHEKE